MFLGVILDEHLTWLPHITNVARQVAKAVGIMYKASFCLSKCSLSTLYYSLVYPYLQYCVSVWGSTYPTNLNRILILQKRAIRIIANAVFDAPSDPIFKSLKILKLQYIYLLQVGKMIFKFKNRILPQTFNNIFMLNSQIHKYNTRRSKHFHVPKFRTNIRKFALRYQGPKLYKSSSPVI